MSTPKDTKHTVPGPGGYERQDVGVPGVVYFLIALAVAAILVHFIIAGLYSFLEKRTEAAQPAISPMIHNAPKDTRKLPADYKDYLKQNFPSPQLEIDERTQLNQIRMEEEQMLASYGYVDEKAGTIRIPIERAMDLIAQRGLPVRGSNPAEQPAGKSAGQNLKGNKQ